jgi:hypothetical protein
VLAITCVAFAVFFSVFWIIRLRHRYAPDLESLLAQLSPSLGKCLTEQQTPDQARQRNLDDEMWEEKQGLRGAYHMFRNAGILLTIASRLEGDGESNGEYANENYSRALVLRISLTGCLLEQFLLHCFPQLPLPRLLARYAFDQYEEMGAWVRAIVEYRRPELLPLLDAAL